MHPAWTWAARRLIYHDPIVEGARPMPDDEKRDGVPQLPNWLKSEGRPREVKSPFTNLLLSPEAGPPPALDVAQADFIPEQKVSFWRRLLAGLGLGIGTSAVLLDPGTAKAEPAVSTPVPIFFDRPFFPATEVTQLANEAIAAHPVNATAAEKSEFRDLLHKAFEEVRKQSADLAEEIAKDTAKEVVEAYVLREVARRVANGLRGASNPIAKSVVSLIDKFLMGKETPPKEPASEARVIILTGCTPVQALSTLHLAGYQLRGGDWLPLGIDVNHRAKKPGRSRAL
jgi:hypothetical protein